MDRAELGPELQCRTAPGTRVPPLGGHGRCIPRFLSCGWKRSGCPGRSETFASAVGVEASSLRTGPLSACAWVHAGSPRVLLLLCWERPAGLSHCPPLGDFGA